MEKLHINIVIDTESMKISATHNFQEVLVGNTPETLGKAYNSVLQGLCRSFGGIIYALIEPRKSTPFYEDDKRQSLGMISKSIDQELLIDLAKNELGSLH